MGRIMWQILPEDRPLPSKPLCGSHSGFYIRRKDFGLKPDTNEHISIFRTLLPLLGT